MRSILSLVQKLSTDLTRRNEYDAYRILDENNQKLLHRIEKLEKKNLKYFCRVTSAVNTAITPPFGRNVPFELTVYPQFGNMHDNIRDNVSISIKRSGVYDLSAAMLFEDDVAVGTYRLATINIVRNGSGISAVTAKVPAAAILTTLILSCTYYLYEGDLVRLSAFQDGVVALNSIADVGLSTPFLSVSERMEDLDPSQYGLLNPEENTR